MKDPQRPEMKESVEWLVETEVQLLSEVQMKWSEGLPGHCPGQKPHVAEGADFFRALTGLERRLAPSLELKPDMGLSWKETVAWS